MVNLTGPDPLILFWEPEKDPQDRVKRKRNTPKDPVLNRIQMLQGRGDELSHFDFEVLGAKDDRQLIIQLGQLCKKNPNRPISLICSLDWDSNKASFFDASAYSRTMPTETAGVGSTRCSFAGLGGQLIIRFPEVWMIFANFGDPSKAAEFVEEELYVPAAGAAVADMPHDGDGRRIAQRKRFRGNLRSASFDTLLDCHFTWYRASANDEHDRGCAIEKFLRHRQCVFDPSGLRSLVKAQLWNQKGTTSEILESPSPARILLDRVVNNTLVVDEEFETSQAVAYSLYRQGRRCWSLVDGADFLFGPWRVDKRKGDAKPGASHTMIARDLQLQLHSRFLQEISLIKPSPDRSDNSVQLQSIEDWDSQSWNVQPIVTRRNGDIEPISANWLADGVDRAMITADANGEKMVSREDEEVIEKPLGSLYFALEKFGHKITQLRISDASGASLDEAASDVSYVDPSTTLIQRLTRQIRRNSSDPSATVRRVIGRPRYADLKNWRHRPVLDSESNSSSEMDEDTETPRKKQHSTQPVFYTLATSLMGRAEAMKKATIEEAMVAGILYQEAFELLAGLNFPTAIKAYSQLQAIEAQIEASAWGTFSARLNLEERKEEVQSVLLDIFASGDGDRSIAHKRTHDHGLQIWSTISGTYRAKDANIAANDSQVESLVYVAGDQKQTGVRARLLELPLNVLHAIILLLQLLSLKWIFRGEEKGKANRARSLRTLTSVWRVFIGTSERSARWRISRLLEAKRRTFDYLARPWDFLGLYFRFLIVWLIYTALVDFLWVAEGWRLDWSGVASTFVQNLASAGYKVVTAAIASELWEIDLSSGLPFWHTAVEFLFLIANFAFLTVLLAVLVKFILRD